MKHHFLVYGFSGSELRVGLSNSNENQRHQSRKKITANIYEINTHQNDM